MLDVPLRQMLNRSLLHEGAPGCRFGASPDAVVSARGVQLAGYVSADTIHE